MGESNQVKKGGHKKNIMLTEISGNCCEPLSRLL